MRYDGSVGSASAYQIVESEFESRLGLIFLTRLWFDPVKDHR